MKNELMMAKREAKTDEMKVAHFKRCPCCKCDDLVKFEVDYFCMACDWNSVLFDVYSGNFEKRIALVNKKIKSKAKALRSDVLSLSENISSKEKEIQFTNKKQSRLQEIA